MEADIGIDPDTGPDFIIVEIETGKYGADNLRVLTDRGRLGPLVSRTDMAVDQVCPPHKTEVINVETRINETQR
jgi:hypothetical protein